MHVLQLVVLVGEGHVERPGEAVAEVVGGARLQRLAVVHQCLDGVGGHRAGELVAFGLAALDDGHIQHVFAEIGVDVQHLLGLRLRLLGGGVDGVSLLPQELAAAQERAGGLFPPHHVAPLVVELGQVAVGVDDVGVVLAEQRFRRGAHAQALRQRLAAAVGHPGHLGCEALHVVFFLLQKAFRDEQGHIDVFMSQRLEALVHLLLDQLPDGVAVGADDHAALDAGIVDQVRLFDHVRIPLGEILLHGGDRLYHFFVVVCHNVSSFRDTGLIG